MPSSPWKGRGAETLVSQYECLGQPAGLRDGIGRDCRNVASGLRTGHLHSVLERARRRRAGCRRLTESSASGSDPGRLVHSVRFCGSAKVECLLELGFASWSSGTVPAVGRLLLNAAGATTGVAIGTAFGAVRGAGSAVGVAAAGARHGARLGARALV